STGGALPLCAACLAASRGQRDCGGCRDVGQASDWSATNIAYSLIMRLDTFAQWRKAAMRRLTFVLLALLMLSVSGITAQQDSATEEPTSNLTFQLIDSAPAESEELTPGEGITLYFDRPVDCASAEAAV